MTASILAALDYAIELAEKADQKLHELSATLDSAAHSGIAKLKALREKAAEALGVFASSGPSVYASLSDADKAEVDAQMAAIQTA